MRVVIERKNMNNIKVLVVDDNVMLVNMIKEYFSDHANINVCLEAHDGEEAKID